MAKEVSPPKWAAVIDDSVVWSPSREVVAKVLQEQAGILGKVLIQDYNSPNDVVIGEGEDVDLGKGNVFYSLSKDEVQPREKCTEPPKLAYIVDDKPEIVTRPEQTGQTIRDLFHLGNDVALFRDFESPNDIEVKPADKAEFGDGPVFYTRKVEHKLSITVNARVFTDKDGVKEHMTGANIAALVYPQNVNDTTVREVSPQARDIPLEKEIEIHGGEVFDVVRKSVTGGFDNDRIKREIAELNKSEQKATLVTAPTNAIIYRNLRVKAGGPVATTDVLVLIPGPYPGQMIDGAYLPAGSPLIARVKGDPQNTFAEADGKRWQLISYHPHNGGGGPPWNPGMHGFHTYITEIMSWLYDLR
jgi:hypothetical protein